MNFPDKLDPEKLLAKLVANPWIFGIRHHSPACARMLVAAAAELKPQAIALEMRICGTPINAVTVMGCLV